MTEVSQQLRHDEPKKRRGRRSPLDEHKDQILEWHRQGKDTRQIQASLKERGLDISHVSVSKRLNLWMAPTLNKINRRAQTVLTKIEGLVDELQSAFEEVRDMDEMPLPVRNKFRTLIELINTSAKIQGFGTPQNLTQVAVQVNQGADLKKRLWEILKE